MKKIHVCLITTLTFLFTGCAIFAPLPNGKVECDVNVTESKLDGDREAVEFKALPSSFGDFVSIYVKNNTKERIYIEWENARCNSGKVVFSDDRRITMNNAKQDESIAAYSFSLTRQITSKSYVMDDYIIPLYEREDLIKGETSNVYLLIPIKFSDGKVVDYHVKLTYKWVPSNE